MNVMSDKSLNTGDCSSTPHQQTEDNRQPSLAKSHRVYSCGWGLRWLGLGLMLVVVPPSWATTLGSTGNTKLQRNTGDSVQTVCGDFISANNGTPPPIGQFPIFDTCSAMVQTANDATDSGGATGRSLGLTTTETGDALQQISTEEFAASGQLGTEVGSNQINIGINRLVEVRKGARGFSIAGLNPDSKTLLAANSQWFNAYPGEQGGAAGDGDTWDKLGVFLTGNYSTGDRDRTDRTDEFDFDTYGFTLGMDYRFTDSLVLGGAIVYNNIDSNFDTSSTVAGGGVNADGWGGFVYGTYYKDRFYIDGLVGYARTGYDIKRNIFIKNKANNVAVYGGNDIVATAKGSPDSNDYTISAGSGYDFGHDAWSYGPYGRLTYLKVDVDHYRESGAGTYGLNLDVDGQKWKSFTSVIGGQFSYSASQSFGVLVPQGRAGWVHEFENDAQNMTATYVDDPFNNQLDAQSDNPDRDYFEFGLGVSAVFKGGVQAFINYDTLLGLENLTVHYVSVGGRWEF